MIIEERLRRIDVKKSDVFQLFAYHKAIAGENSLPDVIQEILKCKDNLCFALPDVVFSNSAPPHMHLHRI